MGTLVVGPGVDELRRDGQTLTLYRAGKLAGRVPVPPLERVFLQGGLRVDTRALHLLSERGVTVHLLSGRHGRWRATLVGPEHNDARVRVGQMAAYLHGPTRLGLAREIVGRKLRAQADNLSSWADDLPPADARACRTAAESVRATAARVPEASADSLLGHEGAAARAYFEAVARVIPSVYGFAGRTRRPPTDPANALLSLGYTLLHAEWERLVRLVGLDPAVGFYHTLEFGRPSLVCDLVEPWRPAYDRWVVERLRERAFRTSDFRRGGERAGCWLKPAARRAFYLGFEGWAQPLRATWTSEARALAARMAGRIAGPEAPDPE